MWGETDFQQLTAQARLVLLALSTGSQSNLAGIGFYYTEATSRETGLSHDEIEAALVELEKHPAPARSFVVRDRDHGVFWVRDLLARDPTREGDPDVANPKHRTAIETILGSLPRDSVAAKKFRKHYKFRLHTPSRRAPGAPSDRAPVSLEIGDRKSNPGEQKSERRDGRAREGQPLPPPSEDTPTAVRIPSNGASKSRDRSLEEVLADVRAKYSTSDAERTETASGQPYTPGVPRR